MLRAITLHQPWARLIAPMRVKRIETRTWATEHRGELAIHASVQAVDQEAVERIVGVCPDLQQLHDDNYAHGAIVALVQLDDVVEMTPEWIAQQSLREIAMGFYEPGHYGWLLSGVQLLRVSVPCRGWMRLWSVPEDVEAAVRAAL